MNRKQKIIKIGDQFLYNQFFNEIKRSRYELFSCVCNSLDSTWSDNHSGHNSEFCHCVLLLCEPEDYPFVLLDNHTDYKDTLHLHEQT